MQGDSRIKSTYVASGELYFAWCWTVRDNDAKYMIQLGFECSIMGLALFMHFYFSLWWLPLFSHEQDAETTVRAIWIVLLGGRYFSWHEIFSCDHCKGRDSSTRRGIWVGADGEGDLFADCGERQKSIVRFAAETERQDSR